MKRLAQLSWAAVAVAFGEVLLGSWTRINGAGLTCPDYPLCRGRLVPVFDGGVIWEWTHRLTALSLAVMVLAIVLLARRRRARRTSYVRAAANLVGALFLIQALLGAVTVRLGNSPVSVVWHWGTAMALIAALTMVALFALHAESEILSGEKVAATLWSMAPAAILLGASVAAFVTMCIGAYVSSSGAGLACQSLPGCAGHVVVAGSGQYVQMLHRVTAAGTLIVSVGAFAWVWAQRSSLRVRVTATIGMSLVFVQILLGLLNVALRLPLDLREAHAANAALIFLVFASATILAILDASPSQDAFPVPHSRSQA